ncbi:hypothetical protein PSH28_05000 [Pseudomonas resinovorans]|uniref:hypothetical protein n=1 Tax=Metapseudomonas resinovorans TaxID=53412 RepID=UPI00237F6C88|nr:hypothetical protein [Pseudomonas resinovorans]MDE3735942.1 hypothetical protein [Pseudomonas resinovorans]
MAVQPIGEAVFKASGQTYRISASELKQHNLIQNSSGILKDDGEDWSVSFTVTHALGDFTWLVSFTLGGAGDSVATCELVRQPAGLEMLSGMSFELAAGDE